MSIKPKLSTTMAACVLCAGLSLSATSVLASDAGAFLGGMVTAKVLRNMDDRTEAQQAAAYNQPQTVVVQDTSGSSAESRIKELDKLAAGGYITPAEYKAKKQQILDGM